MRPFDPRLARDIGPVKGAIGLTAALSFSAAALLAVQSILGARVISDAFLYGTPWSTLAPLLLVAFGAWLGRTALAATADFVARYFGLRAVAAARAKAVSRMVRVGRSPGLDPGAVSSLLTRGIEGLEIYVARYLPQLVISAIVPLGLGLVIYWLDPLSAVIIVVTIPLIPVFMSLVGWFTSDHIERHWQQVMAVSGSLRDLLSGLPELKVFGRARAQANHILELGTKQQTATMKVLRLSFLSAFVLELLATLSVAIIAVAIGLRLVAGELELWRGLAALVLAPEVYAPLRLLGVHFHAAVEGLEAWQQVTKLMDAEPPVAGKLQLGRPKSVRWEGLIVQAGDNRLRIPDGSAVPGEMLAVIGPSGCGKTSLLESMLGLRHIEEGQLLWEDAAGLEPVTSMDPASIHAWVGYVGQEAWLGEGSVRQVVTRGLLEAPTDQEIRELLQAMNLSSSLEIAITDRDQGVSVGQRRRYAIVRALLRKPAVLVLDEPAAALDFETERIVIDAVRKFCDRGGIAVVVAHRAGFRLSADRVLDFGCPAGVRA